MQNPGGVAAPASTPAAAPAPAWTEIGLAVALTLCFAVALVLKLNQSEDGSHTVQFVLLGVAAVLAGALVAVRRRGAAPAAAAVPVEQNGHMSR